MCHWHATMANKWKTAAFNENEEIVFITSTNEVFSCEKCASRGPEPKIPREKQHHLFESRLSELYVNRRMKPMKELDGILKSLSSKYDTTAKAAYLVIERFGISHGYIDAIKKSILPIECKDIDYNDEIGNHNQFSETSMSEGTWVLDISKIESFQGDFRATGYVKGFHMDLRLILWEKYHYPCNFSFNRVTLKNKELWGTGYCKTGCKATVEFNTSARRSELYLKVLNFDPRIKHDKSKSYVTGQFKSKVLNLLKDKTAIVARTDLKNEFVDQYDPDCPILPSNESLRQISYRENRKNYTARNENSVLAICEMMREPQYLNCIDDVAIYPFSVMYGTPTQEAYVHSEIGGRKRKVISLDATGISVRLPPQCFISQRTGKMKYVFYYSITYHGSERNLPVYQMLSQEHTSDKIWTWLLKWKYLHFRQKSPDEVIIDQSSALTLAVTLAFAGKPTVHEYLSHCFDTMHHKRAAPDCYIRYDRSHVVASIVKNKEMNNCFGKNRSGAKFYKRIVGYLLQEEDIDAVEDIMRKVFILLHSKTLPCEKSKAVLKSLYKLTKTHKIDKMYESEIEPAERKQLFDSKFSEKKSKYYQWICSLEENARMSVQKEHSQNSDDTDSSDSDVSFNINSSNPYYCPSLAKCMIDIFTKLPMTGCVMNKYFGSTLKVPSSSSTEVNFRTVKKSVMGDKKCMRPDIWLEKHLRYILGLIEESDLDSCTEFDNFDSLSVDLDVQELSSDDNSSGDSEDDQINVSVRKPQEKASLKTSPNEKAEQNVEVKNEIVEIDHFDEIDEFDGQVKQDMWKGKNEPTKPKKKLPKSRCISSILNPAPQYLQPLFILTNGSTVTNKSKKRCEILNQMCGFNSITHFCFGAYADSPIIKKICDSSNSEYASLVKIASESRDIARINETRSALVVDLYMKYCAEMDEQCTGKMKNYYSKLHIFRNTPKLISLTCHIDIKSVWEIICKNMPELCSVEQRSVCSNCDELVSIKNDGGGDVFNQNYPFFPIDFNVASVENIQDSLKPSVEYANNYKCPFCDHNRLKIERKSKAMLAFEIDAFTYFVEQIKTVNQFDVYIELSQLQNEIMYGGCGYRLKSVIEFRPGHFVCHILRNNKWETYDDLKTKVLKTPSKVTPTLAFYIRDKSIENSTSSPATIPEFDNTLPASPITPLNESHVVVSSSTTEHKIVHRKRLSSSDESANGVSSSDEIPEKREIGRDSKSPVCSSNRSSMQSNHVSSSEDDKIQQTQR